MTNAKNLMGTKPILPLLVSMSVPSILSMLIQSLYNVVDSIFVAWLSNDALTAVSLAYPLQNLVLAVAVGFGVGINAYIARNLGEGNQHRVDQAASMGVIFTTIHAVIFILVGLFGSEPFLHMFTNDPDPADECQLHPHCDLSVLWQPVSYIYRKTVPSGWEHGRTDDFARRRGDCKQIAGAAANIVLDPILIFGMFGLPAMGVTGAAVATVTGQMTACGLAVFCFLRTRTGIRITRKDMKIDAGIAKRIYAVGVPSGLMTAMPSLLVSILNALLVGLHTLAVAAFGLYFKLQTFVYMPGNGLIQGMRPIVSYNYGAGQGRRLHLVIRWSLALTAIIMALGTLIAWGVPRQIMGLFDADEAMIAVGVPMLRITSLGFLVSTLGTVMAGCFEALGKGLYSLSISLLRQLLVIPPLAMVFSLSWGLNGVWAAFPVAEALAALVAVLLYRKVMRQTDRQLQNSEVDCAGGKYPGSRNP